MGSWKGWFWVASVLFLIGAAGCDDDDHGPAGPGGDYYAPAIPRGLVSITADGEVFLRWYPNQEPDLDGYRIYRNSQASGTYSRIGWVYASQYTEPYEEYVDRDVLNGRTYYYAVSAVDDRGNESDLSLEVVYDTPRPEGYGVRLRNFNDTETDCAFDFSDELVTFYTDIEADIAYVYDRDSDTALMWGLDDPNSGYVTELQDAGWHESMDAVGWAPPDGWSPFAAVELIPGHVYVAWTRDDHYAKFQVVQVSASEVEFDWAYQVDRGNQELREDSPITPQDASATIRRTAPVARRAGLELRAR